MEQILNQVRVAYSDSEINQTLKAEPGSDVAYSRHFSQEEDFFLRLPEPIVVPSIPIHHNVYDSRPTSTYIEALRTYMSRLYGRVPTMLNDLTYLFDPSEIFRPSFFHLYRLQDRTYLYLLRLDISYKPQIHEATARNGNDVTPEYRTDRVYLESDFIPLADVHVVDGKIRSFDVMQSISQTWIGETGRGYFVQGIWLDRELTKFFSKLFIPKGKRMYPYFPFSCKHKAICHTVLELGREGRKKALPRLHRAREFLEPRMSRIEAALRSETFSEELEEFTTMQAEVDMSYWESVWQGVSVAVYLNDLEMREYRIETD